MEHCQGLSIEDGFALESGELLPEALEEALGEAITALTNEPAPDGVFTFQNCCLAIRVKANPPMEDEPGETKDLSCLVLYQLTSEGGAEIFAVVPDENYIYLVQ